MLVSSGYTTKEWLMRRISLSAFFLLAGLLLIVPAPAPAQIAVGVGISVHIGPPALPVYEQPICPGAGYMWTPGYWAYGADGYYWVPGTWVMAPAVGLLWTPGYWGWGGGLYAWHAGYWGPHIGFYGGINYGFGYGGVGFVGGRWNGGVFAYNTAIMHVDTTVIHTTYVDRTVVNNVTVNNHVAFNGGEGGVRAQPTAEERLAEHDTHTPATSAQTEHEHSASTNRAMLASENHGRPAVAATARPGEFSGKGVVAAHNAPAAKGVDRPSTASSTHADRPNNASSAHADRPPNASAKTSTSASANASHTSANSSNASKPSSTSSSSSSKPAKSQSKPAKSESKPPKESGKPHLR
jgi:hypothetical protein